jgi:hypothetical protein
LDSGKLSLSKNYLRVTEPGVFSLEKELMKEAENEEA